MADDDSYDDSSSSGSDIGALMQAANATTPVAQEYALKTLNRDLNNSGDFGESQAFDKMQANSDQIKQALEQAKQRLLAQQINPAQKWLTIGSALTAPTRSGRIGETISNVGNSLNGFLDKQRQLEASKSQGLLGIDEALGNVDQGVLSAQMQLANLKRQAQSKMDVESLKVLGRQVAPPNALLRGLLPPEGKLALSENLVPGTPEFKARVDYWKNRELTMAHPSAGAIDPSAIDFGSYMLYKSGKMPAMGMGNAPARSAMLAGAAKLAEREAGGEDISNSGYDQALANNQDFTASGRALGSFAGGPLGNQTRSLNNVVGHLKLFQDTFSALKNGDVQLLNRLGNRWDKEIGKSAPTTLKAMASIIGPELTKILAGANAGSKEEREEFAQQAGNLVNSPEQIKDALDKMRGMLGRQATDLAIQYHGATGRNDFAKRYLHSDVAAALELNDEPSSTPKGGQLPPQALAALKEGHITQFANGQKWTLHNGQAAQVQ